MRPNLIINAGLRYEFFPPLREKLGEIIRGFRIGEMSELAGEAPTAEFDFIGQVRDPKRRLVGSADPKDKEKLLASHPLVQDGRKLIPSITRVFRRDQKVSRKFAFRRASLVVLP